MFEYGHDLVKRGASLWTFAVHPTNVWSWMMHLNTLCLFVVLNLDPYAVSTHKTCYVGCLKLCLISLW
jgi:hypothetical protein